MYIPTQLRKLIMNSIHRNHPGQSGMMHLANMIWFPRIHREIVTLTQNCQPCIKIDKRRGLKQPMLKADTIWNLESDSEPQLDIQFQPTIEGDDSSDQSTLQNIKKKAIKQKKQFKQSKQKDQLDRPEEPTNINEAHFYSQPGPSHQLDIPGPNNRNPPQRKRKQQPTKRSTKPKSDFDRKSKEAAIAQSKLNKAKERQRKFSNSPRIQMDTSKLEQNKSIEVINLISDSSQGSPIKIFTSDDPTAFMSTPGRKKSQEQVNKKIDKIIHRITHSPKKQQNNDEKIISITPANHTRLSQDIISINPAHQSTPVDPITKTMTTTQDYATTSTNDYQLVKHNAPTNNNCENENSNQLVHTVWTTDTNSDTTSQDNYPAQTQNKETIKHTKHHNIEAQPDIPEEREKADEPIDLIHMEEDNGESLTTSSISSLNTEDFAALDKLFD